MPKKFDGKGILSLALQVLGITEDNIFSRIEKKIGADEFEKVKLAWEATKATIKGRSEEGWQILPPGKLDAIRDGVIDEIINWVKTTIVKKAMIKLSVLFIPFAGLIAAAKTLWQTINYP